MRIAAFVQTIYAKMYDVGEQINVYCLGDGARAYKAPFKFISYLSS